LHIRCVWEAGGARAVLVRVYGIGLRVGVRNTGASGRCPSGVGPHVDQ
jgi:hypothetical protein